MVIEMICVFAITNVYDMLPSVVGWVAGRASGLVKKYGRMVEVSTG